MVSKIYGKEYIYKNIFINVKMEVVSWIIIILFSLGCLFYLWTRTMWAEDMKSDRRKIPHADEFYMPLDPAPDGGSILKWRRKT